jgi:hypothetical protein
MATAHQLSRREGIAALRRRQRWRGLVLGLLVLGLLVLGLLVLGVGLVLGLLVLGLLVLGLLVLGLLVLGLLVLGVGLVLGAGKFGGKGDKKT